MDLDKVFEGRRSIRFFENEPLNLDLVKAVIKSGLYAPTACNRQHWEAIIVSDEITKERMFKEGGAQRTIIGAPVIVVITVDMRFNTTNYDNVQSASAAVENMLLKAVDLGLGSCWVVGFGNKENVRKILNIPDYFEPLCYILLGKKNEKMKIPFLPPKKDLNEITHLNKYAPKTIYLPNSIKPKDWTLEQIREHQRFVSRARHLGIDYDFYSLDEISEINNILKENIKENKKVYVLLGYDGTILKNIVKTLENNEIIDSELGEESINFVKFKTDKPKYVIFEKKELNDKEVDFVISPFTLEKVPDLNVFLKESNRVLKENGKIIVFLKNKLSFYGLMYFGINRFLGVKKLEGFFIRSGPFIPLSIFKVKNALIKNGFKIEKTKGIFFIPSETTIFLERLDGYLKRHGKKLSFLKHFLKHALTFSIYIYNLTKWVKFAHFNSSSYIIGEKSKDIS